MAIVEIAGRMEGGLAYRRYSIGEGREWVVLIPGAGAAGAIWHRQIAFLRQRNNLIVVDLPGHGRSLHGKGRESYSFESIAERIVAILDREQIERAHLVSMSLGGLIAETIALRWPERVISLVLAGGVARLDLIPAIAMFLGWMFSAITPYLILYRIFAWLIMPGRRHAKTRRIFASHATRVGRDEFLRWFRMCPEALPLFRCVSSRPAEIPTLFLMGDRDLYFRRSAERRSRMRSDTSVVTIAHCGHVCSVEQPREFNRILGAFLDSHCDRPEASAVHSEQEVANAGQDVLVR